VSSIQELVQIYLGMRAQGIHATRALEILRPQINTLPANDQVELVRQVKVLEAKDDERKFDTLPTADSKPKIKPISKPIPRLDPKAAARTIPIAFDMAAVPEKKTAITCPNCGRMNKTGALLCIACGQPLLSTGDTTRNLREETNTRDAFFGSESVLVLTTRESNVSFKIRPQQQSHDLVIGRSDSSVRADIDLSEFGAATMGVSRMHLTLHYDPKTSTLSVTDMNTVNGTFVNGMKLLPNEVRVLRHGDELRLGQLTLMAHFYFAET
jgi:hypothetical protein